jgi:hypothetical protein
MITHVQIAELLVTLYAADAETHPFDFFEPGNGDSGICWALTKSADEYVFLLRGSKTLEDWFRDLIALTTPFEHNDFGPVHPGFLLGMDAAVDEMLGMWDHKTPITIAGHSLGAGRAALAVAILLCHGVPAGLMRRVVFGEPKPGLCQLAEFIAAVPGTSYRNGTNYHHDYITDVPPTIYPLEAYLHPNPLTMVEAPPDSITAKLLDVFGFHHMPLYLAGVKKLLGAQ